MTPRGEKNSEMAVDKSAGEPKFWGPIPSVVLALAVYFATQLVAGIGIAVYTSIHHWSSADAKLWFEDSVLAQFITILIIEILVVGAVYGLLRLRKFSMKKIGLAWPTTKDILVGLGGVVVYYALFLGVVVAIKQFVPGLNLDQKQQLGFDNVVTKPELTMTFISLVILPPIAEEILVRGFLYTGLRSKLRFIPALLLTSLIFATAHLQFGSGAPLLWAAFIDTFILSTVLVYLREKRGTLGASMVVHMVKNGIAFAALFIFAFR